MNTLVVKTAEAQSGEVLWRAGELSASRPETHEHGPLVQIFEDVRYGAKAPLMQGRQRRRSLQLFLQPPNANVQVVAIATDVRL